MLARVRAGQRRRESRRRHYTKRLCTRDLGRTWLVV